ncbi:hypothetical protein CHLRE_03g149001v5 [Chlamydomonas reinhardtii]|uniref:Uncharacterized protein n=1 Tax=Chlamydomonas reinhardtii TaxID=3055 RepID=A0A2K3DVJ6_CHLRE|nr:uncharacterized protein CHLRE_03g149001v5 [Chlamydomonas reinhardtii]PNW84561.1 hypothetical protein CHLRE_03g149001v5 [Chlamydomonas reinhardtii]
MKRCYHFLGAPEQQAAAATWQSAAEAPSGHDFEVLWELLEPDDEGPEWEAGLLPRERELLPGADPGLLASRAATALAHFSTVPRAIRRLLRLRPGTLLAGGTFRVALQQPLMVMASFLGCSLPATVVMCAEEPRLMEVPVIQLSAAREAIRTTIRVAWCPYEEDDATAAAATLLLRARPGLALEPASVLLARADTLALLHWHVLAGLGGGELNRWLNPEDVTTTTAGVAYSRSQSRVSDSHSRRGGMPQPPPHAVLTPSDANRLAAAMSVPLHVMLRLLWLRRKRGSCEYATSVLRLRCRHNDAKAALASAASWPRDAR